MIGEEELKKTSQFKINSIIFPFSKSLPSPEPIHMAHRGKPHGQLVGNTTRKRRP